MKLEEALEEGEKKCLEKGLISLRKGEIHGSIFDMRTTAESQGKLGEFYEALKISLPLYLNGSCILLTNLTGALENLEVVEEKLKAPLSQEYKKELADKVIGLISKGKIYLKNIAIIMRKRDYPI